MFHHLTHLHTFLFYGRRLYRAFGRHFAGLARSCIFSVVLCGCLGLVQVVNAEWTDADAQKLLEIITRLDNIKQSVDNVPNPNTLLNNIEQAVNGQQSTIGVGRVIKTQEDFHSTFLTRFGFTGSGNDLSGRLLAMQNILSSIETKNSDLVNMMGYTGTNKLKTDMTSIVTKLEQIRTALSSSGTSGGISESQLSSALKSQFGAKFGLSGSSNPKVLAYSVNSSGSWVNEIFDTGSIPVLFSRLNQQMTFLGDYLKYWNGQYLTTKVSNKLDTISDDLNTIISKMGTGSSSGSVGLTSEELDAILLKYFGFPASGGQSFYASRLNDVDINGVRFSSAIVTPTGSPKDLVSSLFYMNNVLGNFLDNNSRNQLAFSRLFWKAIMGSSGSSSTSNLVRDGFVTYSFGDSPAFYADGKPWRLYTESVFNNPQNLLEALAVINTNLARFSNVQSKNMYALGDQNYWSTTNIVSRIDPNVYWGNSENDLSTLETNKTFEVSVNTGVGGSTPPSSADYAPVITNDLSVVQIQINENTNRLYEVRADEVHSRYLRDPFGKNTSSASIGNVSAGSSEILEVGGVTLDFGEAYSLYKEKFWSFVGPKVKAGFGFLWTFLAVLYASIAIRKTVTGGV